MHVGVIDLGINNLSSVQRGFSTHLESTDSLTFIENDSNNNRPELLILPGLGTFSAGMAELKNRNLMDLIMKWKDGGTKIVGICLGMQLLGSHSEESFGVEGLNLVESKIVRLPDDGNERIPHTGWAEALTSEHCKQFPSLSSQGDFYFVHSYHLVPLNKQDTLTTTKFGNSSFVSSVFNGNIMGVQFHPEKSGKKGKALISEIISWARNEN